MCSVAVCSVAVCSVTVCSVAVSSQYTATVLAIRASVSLDEPDLSLAIMVYW